MQQLHGSDSTTEPGVVTHDYSSATVKSESKEPQVQGQPVLRRERETLPLPQNSVDVMELVTLAVTVP